MAIVMNASEFVEKLKDVATNYKTLYVMGCFGAPMTSKNKARYCNNHSYNMQSKRTEMIQAATSDTFGFDCVCLIKGILWGWNGDTSKTYGGAKYAVKGVPDITADAMIDYCSNISTDFSDIEIGEAVWCPGHIGVYIGNGLAVESTPAWKSNVQITAVRNIGTKSGYNARTWKKHGMLPWIRYNVDAPVVNKVETKVETKVEITDTKIEGHAHYGIKTFIEEVQAACGATVDGVPGEETLSKTVTISAKKNRTHPVVKAVQKRLYTIGYTEVGDADGIAGPKFTKALKRFQKENNCPVVDGEATKGKTTWRKLLWMS